MIARPLLALATALLIVMPALAQKSAADPTAATKGQPTKDPVVAAVNGEDIHLSDAARVMQMTAQQSRQQMTKEQLYQIAVNQLVADKLFSQAGRKAKLADDPDVKRRVAEVQENIVGQAYLDKYLTSEITDAKVKARYDELMKDYKPQEQVSARHILVKTEDEAKAVIAQLKGGADFATIAKEKSTDEKSKTTGGDLGWFSKNEMVPEFSDAAFKLQKGQYTDTPVKTQFGYHVIKVEDRRIAPAPAFDEVKDRVKDLLARDLAEQKLKELQATAKVEVFNADGSKPQPAPASEAGPRLTPPGGAPAPAASQPAPALAPPDLNH